MSIEDDMNKTHKREILIPRENGLPSQAAPTDQAYAAKAVEPINPMVGTMIVEKAAVNMGMGEPHTIPTNPKQAYGDKKVPLHLVPPVAIAYMGMALKDGAKKYGPYNWRTTNVEVMTYLGAALRHIGAYIDGEDTDPESGNPHLAHALASLAILVDAVEGATEIDNRPLPGNGGNLIRREAARATK